LRSLRGGSFATREEQDYDQWDRRKIFHLREANDGQLPQFINRSASVQDAVDSVKNSGTVKDVKLG
jgi:hypothetical protein